MMDPDALIEFTLQAAGTSETYKIRDEPELEDILYLDKYIETTDRPHWEGIARKAIAPDSSLEDVMIHLVRAAMRDNRPDWLQEQLADDKFDAGEFDNQQADDEMGRGINMETEGQPPRNPRSLL